VIGVNKIVGPVLYARQLLKAAKELREAQKHYMLHRGNNTLGQIVAERAKKLDKVIEKAEGK
jgi:ppGpp synthetase/RelA/SpoT-type nucleotidyltranferase